jgi:hypothetical protein
MPQQLNPAQVGVTVLLDIRKGVCCFTAALLLLYCCFTGTKVHLRAQVGATVLLDVLGPSMHLMHFRYENI